MGFVRYIKLHGELGDAGVERPALAGMLFFPPLISTFLHLAEVTGGNRQPYASNRSRDNV